MALTKVDISMLEDAGATGQVLTSDGTNWTSAAAAGGDSRRFAIDGDFTQWPEGVGPTTSTGGYSAAMMSHQEGTDGTMTWERSADVPTRAQSGHQSAYSILLKCTGTDTSIGASQYQSVAMYHITGSDFGSLHQQAVCISFWAKTSAANSGHTYYFQVDNRDTPRRTYVKSFVPTSSWAKYSFPVAFDTVGTWTNMGQNNDYSMRMIISGAAGSTTDDGTDGAWTDGFDRWASSGPAISNFMDDTSNEWYMSQFQIALGTSTPTFVSPSSSTVKDEVEFYVETKGTGTVDQSVTTYESFGSGVVYSAGDAYCHGPLYRTKRRIPTLSLKGSNPLLRIFAGGNIQACTVTAFQNAGISGARTQLNPATNNLTPGQGCWFGGNNGNAYILIDARQY